MLPIYVYFACCLLALCSQLKPAKQHQEAKNFEIKYQTCILCVCVSVCVCTVFVYFVFQLILLLLLFLLYLLVHIVSLVSCQCLPKLGMQKQSNSK